MATPDGRRARLTASQTVGPYLAIGLAWQGGEHAVAPGTPGSVTITGTVYDGAGQPVPDALVETWQYAPDVAGRRFTRSQTVDGGRFTLTTPRPRPVPGPGGTTQAPHLAVSVLARGLLDRVVTRVYLPEDAHDDDPVLAAVPAHRRPTLVAVPAGDGTYRFDVRLQGEGETVFFAV